MPVLTFSIPRCLRFPWERPSRPRRVSLRPHGHTRDTGIDLIKLRAVRNICMQIREKYAGLINPISERVDSDVLIYQLPGGMISNLVSQLQEQDALNRMDDVLAEIPRVREELGYPPLVTPTSQIVGTQAVLNVLAGGERYRTVTQEVKEYIHGLYGKSPAPVNEEIRRQIIGNDSSYYRPACRPARTRV